MTTDNDTVDIDDIYTDNLSLLHDNLSLFVVDVYGVVEIYGVVVVVTRLQPRCTPRVLSAVLRRI